MRRWRWILWLLPAAAQLAGWKELKDHQTGRVYYLNQKTGETAWHPEWLSPQLVGSCESVCQQKTCGDWLLDKAQTFYSVKEHKVRCDLAHIAMLKACPDSCNDCEAQHACANAPDFHCQASGDAEMRTWAESRLRWCCEHRSVGCHLHQKLPSPYDCDVGQQNAWSESKTAWCCSIERKGCRFDCYKQLAVWAHTWSMPKRAWCCSHQKLGCIKPKEFDCTEGVVDARHWSDVKRHYCCHIEGVGCQGHFKPHKLHVFNATHDRYTCTGRDWPLDKIKWCCLAKQVGCKMLSSTTTTTMVQLFDCQAGMKSWERGWSHRKKMWCCKTHHMGCAFDCREHLSTWQVSWSAGQKTFCCATFKLGCVSLGLRPLPQPVPGHFDCSSRPALWPDDQQRWCCRNHGLGCELDALPYGHGDPPPPVRVEHVYHWHGAEVPPPVPPPKPTAPETTLGCDDATGVGCDPVLEAALPEAHLSTSHGSFRVFSADPYHCHAGSELDWSSPKRHFCCAVRRIGCEVHSIHLGNVRFDCNTYDEHWKTTWSDKQKSTCCREYGIGCPNWHPPQIHVVHTKHLAHKEESFDCDAGTALADSWPVAKRAFCCRYEAKGCSDSAAPRYDCHAGQKDAWSKAKMQWCCDVHNLGCSTKAYDCSRDIAHRHEAWSPAKQRFCCDSFKVGCPKTRQWLQKLLVAPTPATTTPAAESFDCRAGVRHWKEGWSSQKASWCCAHHGYGCPFMCSLDHSDWKDDQRQWCCEHRQLGCVSVPAKKFELNAVEARGQGVQWQICALASVVLLSLFSLRVVRYRHREAHSALAE